MRCLSKPEKGTGYFSGDFDGRLSVRSSGGCRRWRGENTSSVGLFVVRILCRSDPSSFLPTQSVCSATSAPGFLTPFEMTKGSRVARLRAARGARSRTE